MTIEKLAVLGALGLAATPALAGPTIQYGCAGATTAVADLDTAVGLANATISDDCIVLDSKETPGATLDITDTLTIQGRGFAVQTDSLPAGASLFHVQGTELTLDYIVLNGHETDVGEDHRALEIDTGSDVVLTNVVMADFRTMKDGTIFNEGDLTVRDSEFENNFSHSFGGAIYHAGPSLIIEDSAIHDNEARFGGGGVALDGDGASVVATMTRSSVHDNVAGGDGVGGNAATGWTLRYGLGGGVYNHHATFTATNCTFTENIAEDDTIGSGTGGNLYLADNYVVTLPSTFNQVTVAEGTASEGESVYANHDNVTFDGSIIEATSQACSLLLDLDGNHNVLSDSSCTFVGGSQTYADPQLDTQQGFPAHRPFTSGSPAEDLFSSSDPECQAEDQRGVSRPQGGDCDAGAFELD